MKVIAFILSTLFAIVTDIWFLDKIKFSDSSGLFERILLIIIILLIVSTFAFGFAISILYGITRMIFLIFGIETKSTKRKQYEFDRTIDERCETILEVVDSFKNTGYEIENDSYINNLAYNLKILEQYGDRFDAIFVCRSLENALLKNKMTVTKTQEGHSWLKAMGEEV